MNIGTHFDYNYIFPLQAQNWAAYIKGIHPFPHIINIYRKQIINMKIKTFRARPLDKTTTYFSKI